MLAVSLASIWSPELQKNNITVDWLSDIADHVATVEALPEQKSGCKKANTTYMSDSKGKNDPAQFGGLERDAESLVDVEDSIKSDGKSFLQHLTHYTDSKSSDSDDLESDDL